MGVAVWRLAELRAGIGLRGPVPAFRGVPAAVFAAALAMLVAPGCGGDEESQAVRVIPSFQRAVVYERPAEACAMLTVAARRHFSLLGHGRSDDGCPADLTEFAAAVDASLDGLPVPRPEVTSVSVDGDQAVATIEVPGGPEGEVPLAKEDGEWRINALYGDIPAQDQKDRLASAPVPGHAAELMLAQGGPTVEMAAPARELELWTLSVLGDAPFGRECRVSFDLTVDGDGAVVLSGYHVNGPWGCADARGCLGRGGFGTRDWHGRLEDAGDGFELVLDACLDTCMGRFAGELTMAVRRSPQGWRLVADDTTVGTSGWRYVGGSWPLRDSGRLDLIEGDRV